MVPCSARPKENVVSREFGRLSGTITRQGEQDMNHQKGKWHRRKNGALSLLFVPHGGRLRTLRILHWKALFRAMTLAVLLAASIGAVFTARTLKENQTLKRTLSEETARHTEALTNLNALIADQASLLEETNTTLAEHKQAAARSERTLSSYKSEYETLVVAYLDTNLQGLSVSRGESDGSAFRQDVSALKALLKTAEEAAWDATEQDTALTRKAEEIAEQVRHLPSLWPTVADAQVHSAYGRRLHPVFRYYRKHEGVDLGEHTGDPLYASGAGTVTKAEWHVGYGNLVEIDHGNGYVTRYGHCSKILVKVGDVVDQGQEIAKMGETGTATGPHVHFEIRVHGSTVDPLPYIRD
jgi:murein DD-endopeptidase MepM/ murein hydrolase activator NlpD